ncbi:hypothetical protein IJE86_07700 [bacterium]|nr:hypothetical protein [bacterium]
MDNKLEKFSIDVASFEIVPEEYSDSQLAVVEIYVCHDGNNRHNVPITREALVRAKDTLKNKFLVAGFDGNDFEGHEPDEQIVGFFPESSKMKFEKRKGRTYLVAQAIMSKVYANWAYEIFKEKGNHRDVSMEITVLAGQVDENDNLLTIEEFVFNGVTILGLSHVPACEGSSASIIKFDCENALKVYNEHRDDTAMVEFSGKEEKGTMDETKDIVEEVETTVNAETEDEAKEVEETTETKEESSKEDDNTMYSEDDKEKDFESEDDKSEDDDDKDDSDDSDDEDESKEDIEEKVENEAKSEEVEDVEKECKNESDVKDVEKECKNEENLPTENCETDEPEKEEDPETVKAERDSLKAECEVLRDKVEKYEAKEKSVQVESIISSVLELFSAEEISELKEESEKYSLDELNIFENEVKAKSYDKMINNKNFSVKEKSFTKMAVNDVLDNKQNTSKYTWE